MTERYHAHVEQISRERAVHLGQAMLDVGNGKLEVIGNEGEQFITNQGRDALVGEGNVAVRVGAVGDHGPVYQRAEQIAQQAAQEQKVA